MLGLFNKKSPLERLQEQHHKLLKQAFDLSKINRRASDSKFAEAEALMQKIERFGS